MGELSWDEAKRAANLAKHGVDFAAAGAFEWNTALTRADERQRYGEPRFVSIGFIGPRLHVLVWTPRQDGYRIISLHKANRREIRRYAENI
ncbi:MAG: BrnT family toxin [Azospirillum sp.]|nr:BrnT family toxin [Azospirillum sp.]